MKALTLLLLANLAMTGTVRRALSAPVMQHNQVAIASLNSSGLPVSVKAASAESTIVSSWLEFTVTNASSEEISELSLIIISLNSDNELVTTQSGFHEPIAAGSTRKCEALIDRAIDRTERNFLLITKAKSDSGVWSVDVSDLATRPDSLSSGGTLIFQVVTSRIPSLRNVIRPESSS